MESHLQLNSCIKNFVIGFPQMPCIVADSVGGPGLEKRAEKVAPVSSRKLIGWLPTVRVTPRLLCCDEEPKWEAPGPSSLDSGSEFLTPEKYCLGASYSSSDLLCKVGARPWL